MCKYQFNNIKWLERIHKNSDHWNIILRFEDAGKGEKQPSFFFHFWSNSNKDVGCVKILSCFKFLLVDTSSKKLDPSWCGWWYLDQVDLGGWSFRPFLCWFWRILGGLGYQACIHWETEWPPELHRSWSLSQNQNLCICLSASHGSPEENRIF